MLERVRAAHIKSETIRRDNERRYKMAEDERVCVRDKLYSCVWKSFDLLRANIILYELCDIIYIHYISG